MNIANSEGFCWNEKLSSILFFLKRVMGTSVMRTINLLSLNFHLHTFQNCDLHSNLSNSRLKDDCDNGEFIDTSELFSNDKEKQKFFKQSGYFNMDDEDNLKVCKKHAESVKNVSKGKYGEKKRACASPLHTSNITTAKGNLRQVSEAKSREIFEKIGHLIPVGTNYCDKCRKDTGSLLKNPNTPKPTDKNNSQPSHLLQNDVSMAPSDVNAVQPNLFGDQQVDLDEIIPTEDEGSTNGGSSNPIEDPDDANVSVDKDSSSDINDNDSDSDESMKFIKENHDKDKKQEHFDAIYNSGRRRKDSITQLEENLDEISKKKKTKLKKALNKILDTALDTYLKEGDDKGKEQMKNELTKPKSKESKLLEELIKVHNSSKSPDEKLEVLGPVANTYNWSEIESLREKFHPNLGKAKFLRAKKQYRKKGQYHSKKKKKKRLKRGAEELIDVMLDLILERDIVSPEAYGTQKIRDENQKKMKDSDGNDIVLPVLSTTQNNQRLLEMTKDLLEEKGLTPPGDSTIKKLLKALPLKLKGSLQNANPFQTLAMEGFENMKKIVDVMDSKAIFESPAEKKALLEAIDDNQRYVRSTLKFELSQDADVGK